MSTEISAIPQGHFVQANGLEIHYEEYADFEKITSPTLILSGDRDEFTPVEEAVEMYRLIPRAELAIFPNANHGETVYGNSGVNPLFMSTVLDFLLRQYNPRL